MSSDLFTTNVFRRLHQSTVIYSHLRPGYAACKQALCYPTIHSVLLAAFHFYSQPNKLQYAEQHFGEIIMHFYEQCER